MLTKNKRKISHNLIISKYFDEENQEIQTQYFLRNVADELSVISLGFDGFFVVINPCSFSIEYSSDTFHDLGDINLVEVEKFEARAATVFRIENQKQMPEFNLDYIRGNLSKDQKLELDNMLKQVTGINNQYTISQGKYTTSFDKIEIDAMALELANYKHIDDTSVDVSHSALELSELEKEIEFKKQQLLKLDQQLSTKQKPVEPQVEIVTEDTLEPNEEIPDLSTADIELDPQLSTKQQLVEPQVEIVTEDVPETNEEIPDLSTADLELDQLMKELDKLDDFLD